MVNLLFTISTAEGGLAILLEDLVIHQDHRRQGYGSQLLQYALAFAREKHFVRVTILTDRQDTPSIKFFARHGFAESGMVPMRIVWDVSTPI
jgi:GNAT superfamily N-acetyltransferase